ncbi:MAG: EboA domain-containing protein [Planctomycetota bacterium]
MDDPLSADMTTETTRARAAQAARYQALEAWLAARLDAAALAWLRDEARTLGEGADGLRFGLALSKASRYAKDTRALAPSVAEREALARLVPGLDPERWTLLETVRIALTLALADLADEPGRRTVEEAFRYADEGEARALYRSLALLPGAHRFVQRGAEGCRTNMRSVFEATALDTPFPRDHFDDVAWRQLVIKSLFVEAPLWRLVGLDERLDADLARMALDLREERTSAGRPIYPELYACFGAAAGARGRAALGDALRSTHAPERAAAAVALVRAGHAGDLEAHLANESDDLVQGHGRRALAGETDSRVFGALRADAPA